MVLLAVWVSGLAATANYRDAAVAQQAVADIADTVMVRGTASTPGAPTRERYFVFFRFEGLFWSYAPELGTRVCGVAPEKWPPPTARVTDWIRQVDPALSLPGHVVVVVESVIVDLAAGEKGSRGDQPRVQRMHASANEAMER